MKQPRVEPNLIFKLRDGSQRFPGRRCLVLDRARNLSAHSISTRMVVYINWVIISNINIVHLMPDVANMWVDLLNSDGSQKIKGSSEIVD